MREFVLQPTRGSLHRSGSWIPWTLPLVSGAWQPSFGSRPDWSTIPGGEGHAPAPASPAPDRVPRRRSFSPRGAWRGDCRLALLSCVAMLLFMREAGQGRLVALVSAVVYGFNEFTLDRIGAVTGPGIEYLYSLAFVPLVLACLLRAASSHRLNPGGPPRAVTGVRDERKPEHLVLHVAALSARPGRARAGHEVQARVPRCSVGLRDRPARAAPRRLDRAFPNVRVSESRDRLPAARGSRRLAHAGDLRIGAACSDSASPASSPFRLHGESGLGRPCTGPGHGRLVAGPRPGSRHPDARYPRRRRATRGRIPDSSPC